MKTDSAIARKGAGSSTTTTTDGNPDTATDDDCSAANSPTISGPHAGIDRHGRLDHHYWRCERCGLESTDAALRQAGCWRCAEDGGDA